MTLRVLVLIACLCLAVACGADETPTPEPTPTPTSEQAGGQVAATSGQAVTTTIPAMNPTVALQPTIAGNLVLWHSWSGARGRRAQRDVACRARPLSQSDR